MPGRASRRDRQIRSLKSAVLICFSTAAWQPRTLSVEFRPVGERVRTRRHGEQLCEAWWTLTQRAPLAQLDRASVYGTEG